MDDLGEEGLNSRDSLIGNHKYVAGYPNIVTRLELGADGTPNDISNVTSDYTNLTEALTEFNLTLKGNMHIRLNIIQYRGDTDEKISNIKK